MMRNINDANVAKIKELIVKGYSNKSIVETMQIKYRITLNGTTINDIKYGRTYYDVRPDLNNQIKSKVSNNENIDSETIADIKFLLSCNEYSESEIKENYNISNKKLLEIKLGYAPYHLIAPEFNNILGMKYPRKKKSNINNKIVKDIKRQFVESNGAVLLKDLALAHKIDKGTVSTIVNLKCYADINKSYNSRIESILKEKRKRPERKMEIRNKITQALFKQNEEKEQLIKSKNEIKELRKLLNSI